MLTHLSTYIEMSFYVSCTSISPALKCRDIRLIGESDATALGGIVVLIYSALFKSIFG